MVSLLTIEGIGFREARGRFARRLEALQDGKVEMLQDIGEDTTPLLKADAPKRTGLFASGITYILSEKGNTTTVTFVARGEHAFLWPIIKNGSRPHIIPTGGSAAQMAKGYPLRFFWNKGPSGPGIYYFWSVKHPGTKKNNFVKRVNDRSREKWRKELNKLVVKVNTLQ